MLNEMHCLDVTRWNRANDGHVLHVTSQNDVCVWGWISCDTHLISVDCTNSLASSDKSCGNAGSVGCVAILNRAAMGSNSDHGGLVVNISTTVHPRLLQRQRDKMRIQILLTAILTFWITCLGRVWGSGLIFLQCKCGGLAILTNA